MLFTPLFAFSIYWHFPILTLVVSLVYSATRYDQWGAIFFEAFRWGRNLVVFLVGIAAVLYVVAAMT